MRTRRKKADPVVEVTSAPTSPFDEIDARERRYKIAMAIRMVCFIAMFAVYQVSWVAAAVLLVASFVLPMFAVVVANSASPRLGGTPVPPGLTHPELGPGESPHDD